MLEADLIGADAHGVFRLPQYVQRLKLNSTNPHPNITVKRTAPATALVDGDNGMMQAAREVLNKAEEVIAANQEAVHQAIADIATFSASLARNSDSVDAIVKDAKDTMANAKEATASARTLMENLDKRTDDITIGVNKMTATATRQIDIAGKAITDLAHNPQRFLFGGGGSSSEAQAAPAAARAAPAAAPRKKTQQQ